MIFFLFPVVGMYSFFLSSIFFILCSSSSFIFLPLPIQAHTHIFPNSTRTVFHLSLSISLSTTTTKKSNWQKRKKRGKNKKRIYNEFQHMYTHSLSPALSTPTHSQQVGIETSQLSSAQLNFVIKIVKNLLRLYFLSSFLALSLTGGEILVKGPLFFTWGPRKPQLACWGRE